MCLKIEGVESVNSVTRVSNFLWTQPDRFSTLQIKSLIIKIFSTEFRRQNTVIYTIFIIQYAHSFCIYTWRLMAMVPASYCIIQYVTNRMFYDQDYSFPYSEDVGRIVQIRSDILDLDLEKPLEWCLWILAFQTHSMSQPGFLEHLNSLNESEILIAQIVDLQKSFEMMPKFNQFPENQQGKIHLSTFAWVLA